MDFVSIIAPCRNEKEYIKKFLDSMVEQDYPKDNMEFLIADGMSEDGTREIIKEYQKSYPYIQLLDNPKKYTPSALNIAIKKSRGNIIIRVDSHAFYQKEYVSKCVKYLNESGADNVGGLMKTIPINESLVAKSIALCMSHGLGVGNSYFRRGSKKLISVDTVFGGCYKREVFDKIGFFNEHLIRSQDLDFNLRLKRAGGKIILVPDIISYYYPKSTFKEFLRHNFMDGQWAILPLKFTKPFAPRHYALLLFISLFFLLLILSFFSKVMLFLFLSLLGLYIFTTLLFSLIIALEQKNINFLFTMLIAFFIRNFGYGFGSLVGIIKLILWKKEN